MDDKPQAWTPNQVVAYNLRRARGPLTQEEAAERLEPYLGELWSKATFSTAENSTKGRRIRQFTADDVVAFSVAFEKPISFFLDPPAGVTVKIGTETVDLSRWLGGLSSHELEEVQRVLSDTEERLRSIKARSTTPERDTRSGAERIADFLSSLPDPYAGETGRRRLKKDKQKLDELTPEAQAQELVEVVNEARQTGYDLTHDTAFGLSFRAFMEQFPSYISAYDFLEEVARKMFEEEGTETA